MPHFGAKGTNFYNSCPSYQRIKLVGQNKTNHTSPVSKSKDFEAMQVLENEGYSLSILSLTQLSTARCTAGHPLFPNQ